MLVQRREKGNICDICLYLSAVLSLLWACFLIYYVIKYPMSAINVIILLFTILSLISLAGYMCSKWHSDCCSFTVFLIFEIWLILQGIFLVYASVEDEALIASFNQTSSVKKELGEDAVKWQLAIGVGLIVVSIGAILSVCIRRCNTEDVVYYKQTNNPHSQRNYDYYDRI